MKRLILIALAALVLHATQLDWIAWYYLSGQNAADRAVVEEACKPYGPGWESNPDACREYVINREQGN